METLEAITTRRSVRKFTGEPVSPETIKQLVTAALSGPSTGNQQPWQLVVITERAQIEALAEIPAYKAVLSTAPLVIVVCGDLSLNKWGDFWLVDCSIATQNLLLAAHALGLGAVWLGCHWLDDRQPGVKERLGLPEQIVPFAVVPVGVPAQPVKPVERYKPERVRWNRWSS